MNEWLAWIALGLAIPSVQLVVLLWQMHARNRDRRAAHRIAVEVWKAQRPLRELRYDQLNLAAYVNLSRQLGERDPAKGAFGRVVTELVERIEANKELIAAREASQRDEHRTGGAV